MRARHAGAWIGVLLLGSATSALAQGLGPVVPKGARPSERPLPEPEFAPEEEVRPVLPPLTPSERPIPEDTGLRITLNELTFEGNTAISDAALEAVAAPWLGRPLSVAELEALRDALTLAYAREGHRTSGAVFPNQPLGDGTLHVQIVEGRLEQISVEGTSWLNEDYIANRIARGAEVPLDTHDIEQRIRRLQRDPRLGAIHANLRPGTRIGESILDVRIEERNPFLVQIELDNGLSPSLGEVRGEVALTHRSLFGFGDTVAIAMDRMEQGGSIEGIYSIPLNAYETTLELQARYSNNDLVTGLGEDLRIESEYWGLDVTLRQPFEISESLELGLGVTGSLRESETLFLDGLTLPTPGAADDPARVAAIRALADLVWRDTRQVLALRSTLSFGLDAFDSTRNAGSVPESRFTAWLTQLQWVRRFGPWQAEIVARGDLQLASDRLLTLEQFSLGGRDTVRGYRENQLVRDQGVAGSLELRLPVWRDSIEGRALVQLAPFFDIGRVWSKSRTGSLDPPDTLASVGIGLRVQPFRNLRGELYWGQQLYDADVDERSIQDEGFQFRIVGSWP